ncbi:MAG: hypothetical protein JNJ99_12390 [Crocinitomicaceae bacterium]|nr:hypothetical protein [Crocinitomicaceae bacterium]
MSGKNQNYKNHRRISKGFHFGVYGLIGTLMTAGWIVFFCGHKPMAGVFMIFLSVVFASLAFYARLFALRAQDRAIRAEENLRHFILTGKALPAGLRIGQIVALRFASDAELPDLAQKAEKENLKGDEIKKLIQHWRPDFHRV